MSFRITRMLEIVVARILPGVLNVLSLVLLAEYLELELYGIFSTMFATAGLVASLVYGPIKLAIVPLHAEYGVSDRHAEFESSLLGMTFISSLAVLFIGCLASFFFHFSFWLILIVICMGVSANLQQILQARLQFWRYAGGALLQAVLLLALVYFVVAIDPTFNNAAKVYAICIGVGAFYSWYLAGLVKPKLPKLDVIKKQLNVGVPFTLSTLIENLLFMGFRYLLLMTGNTQLLGVFSLAVDIAQRTVGVVINITSFAVLPRAYKALSFNSATRFIQLLVTGALVSGGVALFVLVGVLIVAEFGWFEALQKPFFSSSAFFLISISVIVNRMKKLIVDPLAVRYECSESIWLGYLISAPLVLCVGYYAVQFLDQLIFYMCYFLGYFSSAMFTFLMLSRRMFSR